MALVSDLKTEIALTLHDTANAELSSAQLLTLLNRAVRWARNSGVLIPIEEDESLVEAANTYSFTVPASFAYIAKVIRENTATDTYDPGNEIDQNSWRLGFDGSVAKIFFDEVRYLPSPGATLKLVGQKRPALYTADGDTVDEGLENLLVERTLYYAFQFVAAGRSEYATWRQQLTLLSRAESEQALSRAPQQFRMKPSSRYVPGR